MIDSYVKLDYYKIMEQVASHAMSEPAKYVLANYEPSFDEDEITESIIKTREAYDIKYKLSLNAMIDFEDISPLITKVTAFGSLSPAELLRVARLIRASKILKETIARCDDSIKVLRDLTDNIAVQYDIAEKIDNAILNETELKDSASETLRDIRRKLNKANMQLKEKLDSFTRQSGISQYLQDNLVTIRAGRYVIPVRNDCRSMVPGLVHDMSASGSTAFIEPFAIVEMNNDLRELKSKETAEIERILRELSGDVADHACQLTTALDILIECDVIFAKAEYSESIDATQPIINKSHQIVLKNSRHPLIDRTHVVPVSIDISGDRRILLISGPNTGGKTVALKTVGLFTLMAFSGLFLPCDSESTISIFNAVYSDIGDAQSISESLSTFSSHIKNIADITECITENSLVLLDEVGGGTDPQDGAALACAILKFILSKGATGVITTHYSELKEFAVVHPRIQNCCMQFDRNTFRPTYKLIPGMPGTSNALIIAENIGLNKSIVEDASSMLDGDKVTFENVLKSVEDIKNTALTEFENLQKETAKLNEMRADVEKLKQQLELRLQKLNDGVRSEIKRQASDYGEQAEEIIEEMKKQLRESSDAALFKARELAKRLNSLEEAYIEEETYSDEGLQPLTAPEIFKGDSVYVRTFKQNGIVIDSPNKKGKVRVKVGSVLSEINVSDLTRPLCDKSKKKPVAKDEPQSKRADNSPRNEEIMLIGKTVDESIVLLEPLIDALPSKSTLRIVHGKGSGALGRGIQNYLKTIRRIKSYRYGRYGEGDSGVTIVEIK